MNIDTVKLISEVKARQNLWNPADDLYKNREARSKSWRDVTFSVIDNFNDFSEEKQKKNVEKVQQRWKSSRDAYVRTRGCERKSNDCPSQRTKPYVHYEQMKFLDNVIEPHGMKIETNDSRSEPAYDENQTDFDENLIPFLSENSDLENAHLDFHSDLQFETPQKKKCKTSRKKLGLEEELLSLLKSNKDNEEDEDRAFLLSLLPTLRNFKSDHKLMFRAEVLNILIHIKNLQHKSLIPILPTLKPGSYLLHSSQDDPTSSAPLSFSENGHENKKLFHHNVNSIYSSASSSPSQSPYSSGS